MKSQTSLILGDELFAKNQQFLKSVENDEPDNLPKNIKEFRRCENIGSQSQKYFNPDNFAFIVGVAVGIDRFEKWEDIDLKKEFTIYGTYTQQAYETDTATDWGCNGFLSKGKNIRRCACSHASKTIIYMKALYSGLIVPIGTACIEKHQIINPNDLKHLKKAIKETQKPKKEEPENPPIIEAKNEPKKPKCEYCGKSFIPKYEGGKNCLNCYLEHKKQCIKCGKNFLPSFKTREYAKKCYNCYIKCSA